MENCKTRKFYVRHWAYVVIARSKTVEDYARLAFSMNQRYRHNIDFGMLSESISDDGRLSFVWVIMRKKKPLRFDTICKAFPGCYVTRVPSFQHPSEVAEKWAMKHSSSSSPYPMIFCVDRKTDYANSVEATDDYMIAFDRAFGEVVK